MYLALFPVSRPTLTLTPQSPSFQANPIKSNFDSPSLLKFLLSKLSNNLNVVAPSVPVS
jgi:hypothetical protein